MDEKHKAFLEELKLLCAKYGADIGGCGCCGSPRIDFTDGGIYEDLSIDGVSCRGYERRTVDGIIQRIERQV